MKNNIRIFLIVIVSILSVVFILTGCANSENTDLKLGTYYAEEPENYQGELTFSSKKEMNAVIVINDANEFKFVRNGFTSYSSLGEYKVDGNNLILENVDGSIILSISTSKLKVVSATGYFEDFVDIEFNLEY